MTTVYRLIQKEEADNLLNKSLFCVGEIKIYMQEGI